MQSRVRALIIYANYADNAVSIYKNFISEILKRANLNVTIIKYVQSVRL